MILKLDATRMVAFTSLWIVALVPVTAQPAKANDKSQAARPGIEVLGRPNSIAWVSATPAGIRKAYGFSSVENQGQGQTIAIIAAFDHPSIESDLAVFNNQFNLPPCTTANACFEKVYAAGAQPKTDGLWAIEIALDVEWAHAIAPRAKILLVEAASPASADLLLAVDVAVQRGADVVSMSYAAPESSSDAQNNFHFSAPDVTFVAASGNCGYGVSFPAASPLVLSVGGTDLRTTADGTYGSESAWPRSGGGFSSYQSEPSFQFGAQQSGKRSVPDVSYNAGTEILVYSSIGYDGVGGCNAHSIKILPGWNLTGGTSAGTPQWAALFAIANSSRVAAGKNNLGLVSPTLYALSADLNDIVGGRQIGCPQNCQAVPGYDTSTGLGTPKADVLIPALIAADSGSGPGVLFDSSFVGSPYDVTADAGAGYGLYDRLPFYSGSGVPYPTPFFYTLKAPISYLRVKRLSGVGCDVPANITLANRDSNSLGTVGRGFAVGEFCDFPVSGTRVGDQFTGINFCLTNSCVGGGTIVLDGSASNIGYVADGQWKIFKPGGYAFQICDVRGCSGGFR